MTGYGQFCAVARALEVLGERWTLLIVRELLMGSTGFNEIRRGLPRIPTATLASRLRTLQAAGIVTADGNRYALTPAGTDLLPVVTALAAWASEPGRTEMREDHLDTAALTWDIQRRIDRDAVPGNLTVIEFEFIDRSGGDRRYWLHVGQQRVDLCRTDTGDEVSVWMRGSVADITDWWIGRTSWRDLLDRPGVEVSGDPTLLRSMPTWFLGYALAS
jgi:DNA-binding HxlR family transcriptional regulator